MPETTRLWWPSDSWADGVKRYAPTNFQTRRLEIFSWNTNKYCRHDCGHWTPDREVDVDFVLYQAVGTTNVVYLNGIAKSTYKPTSGSATLRRYSFKYDSALRKWFVSGVQLISLVGDSSCPEGMPATVEEWLSLQGQGEQP